MRTPAVTGEHRAQSVTSVYEALAAHQGSDTWELRDLLLELLMNGLDLKLLHSAQAYLECLQRHHTPGSEGIEAWARFYLICNPLLHRFANSCYVFPDDLDDCVQAAWKEIIVALPAFKDDGQLGRFYAWLHLIVQRKAADLCRYQARHPARSLTPPLEATLTSEHAHPLAEHEQGERQARVRRVLTDLRRRESPTNYRVFELRLIEGHSVSQVAAELDLPAAEVRYRCCRVKRKFRLLYESDVSKD